MTRIVITGATSGIGRAAALALAGQGADVTVVARSAEHGAATVAEIKRAGPGTSPDFVLGDLAELASVREAAAVLAERHDRIDVLIANAGVHATAPRISANGFDHMLASNYLGHFLLTNLLLGAIEAAAPARIVVVASEAHRLAGRFDPENFEDLGDYGRAGSFRAYGRTKLLDILFAAELARRLGGAGVTATSVDPGTVSTGLYAQIPGLRRLAPMLTRTPVVRTPEQGSRMVVRLAADPAFAEVTGRYFSSVPRLSAVPASRALRNPEIQRRVWERTAELVGLAG